MNLRLTKSMALIFFFFCLSWSVTAQHSNHDDKKVSREQAYQNSVQQTKEKHAQYKKDNPNATDNRSMAASFTTGFDLALFESRLESNECVEAQQISVSVVDVVNQVGTFSNGIAGAGLGIDEGIILSTGTIAESFTDNDAVLVSLGSSDQNAIADPDFDNLDPGGQTTHNESILVIDFTVPEGLDGLRVPFQFSSDEYPEYVGTQFNDVFGFFVSGPGITGSQNIALVPGTNNAIAVNSINGGSIVNTTNANNYPASGPVYLQFSEFFIDNTDGTNSGPIVGEYDGYTTVLYAEIDGLVSGATYELKLGIADIADHYGDSAVYIGPLEGLYSGNTVVNCGCDFTDPNIDCDGDGVNNGVDCNAYDDAIAVSGDACTDSNDEAGIIDDNCICIATGEGTSGGNEGGLESNNRLAQKIAKRNFNRTVHPKQSDIQKSNGDIPFKSNNFEATRSGGLNLGAVIPTNVWGAYVAESTPTDLIAITNAVDIIAADYYLNEVRNAVVLAIESEDGVYEHSKYICDRLDGASLLDVSYIDLPMGKFISYKIETKTGLIEYATSFSGYISGTNFVIENHWNLDKYTASEEYYNFQIWASSIEKTTSLLLSILANIENQISIGATITGTIPKSFVKNGYYQNGQLHLNVFNKGQVESFDFRGEYRATETSETQVFESSVQASNEEFESIILDPGYLYDMGISMIIDEDHSDELFIADGTWGYDDLNLNSAVSTFTITPQTLEYEEDVFGIERGIEIQSSVKDYQNIFRSMTPKWETVNLTEFNTISFEAKGSGQIQLTLASPAVDQWNEQLNYTIELSDEFEVYQISLDEFNNYNYPTDYAGINLMMISILGNNVNFEEKNLSIRNINFNDAVMVTAVEDQWATSTLKAYPNPVIDIVTISSQFKGNSVINVYDVQGKVLVQMINNDQKEQIQLDLSSFEDGVYLLEMIHQDGHKETQKIIKL